RGGPAEGRFVRGVGAGEPEGRAQGRPVVLGPAGDRGEIDLAAEQAEERDREQSRERVADAAGVTRVGQLMEGGQQGVRGWGSHGCPSRKRKASDDVSTG